MENFKELMAQFTALLTAIAAFGWALEKVIEFIAQLTPWKWDDNLGVILGKALKKLFPDKTPKP